MKKIIKHYKIQSPIEKVWDALVNPEVIEKWGAGPNVKMSAEVGQEFRLWNGQIYGENTEVHENSRLVQNWYGGEWKEPSIVTINLQTREPGVTNIELVHINLPDDEVESFEKGWDEFYFGPMKALLEE